MTNSDLVSGPATPTPLMALQEDAKAASLARVRLRRRQFVTGGAATAGFVTLKNRSALAQTAGACTVSAVASMSPSHVISGSCGDAAACWKNQDTAVWTDGATFNVGGATLPVPYTHSVSFTNGIFPWGSTLSTAPWTCSADTLLSMIAGNASFTVTLQDGSTVAKPTGAQQKDLCAAILNWYFYGTRYSTSNVLTYINSTLNTISSTALSSSGTKAQINTLFSTMASYLSTLNSQGAGCDL